MLCWILPKTVRKPITAIRTHPPLRVVRAQNATPARPKNRSRSGRSRPVTPGGAHLRLRAWKLSPRNAWAAPRGGPRLTAARGGRVFAKHHDEEKCLRDRRKEKQGPAVWVLVVVRSGIRLKLCIALPKHQKPEQ